MKFPIGIQDFAKLREQGFAYVDKTELLHKLVSVGGTYFLSRPRRFGKSLMLSTLKYYFLGRRDLFKGLAIDNLETEWNQHPVFHLSFGPGNYAGNLNEVSVVVEYYIANFEKEYNIEPNTSTNLSLRFTSAIQAAHKLTGRRVVVLIDEYDKPLLDVLGYSIDGIAVDEHNRQVLKSFYSTLKEVDEHLQFVMLTGVTKFSQITIFSGFNQPNDISMQQDYEAICGITEEEMVSNFSERIAEMAANRGCDFDTMKQAIKNKYDGYHFSKKLTDIYNPFSLIKALYTLDLEDYWFSTATPTYLVQLLSRCNQNIMELVGRNYEAKEFIDYKASEEQPLPMIFQSGYLTIKGYNEKRNSYLLDYPNEEVRSGFISLLASDYFKHQYSTSTLTDMVDCLDNGNLDNFNLQLTSFLASIPYSMRGANNEPAHERHFQYTLYLILRLMSSYVTFVEKEQSQGRVDCIIETDKYVYVMEFKRNGTTAEAMKQIDEKGYATEYLSDQRKVYKVAINFSSATGTIDGFEYTE